MVVIHLIGGPQDGRAIEIEDPPDTLTIAVPRMVNGAYVLDYYIKREDDLKFYYYTIKMK